MTNMPKFVRKQEAAATLLLSVRQVNRLIEEGRLTGAKLSTNRSAVTAASLESYIAERTGAPTAKPYMSEGVTLYLTSDEPMPPNAAEQIDRCLARRFPGIVVVAESPTRVAVTWARSLAYTAEQIGRELERGST